MFAPLSSPKSQQISECLWLGPFQVCQLYSGRVEQKDMYVAHCRTLCSARPPWGYQWCSALVLVLGLEIKAIIDIWINGFLKLLRGWSTCTQILTWNNKLSRFIIKSETLRMVGGNRVHIHPWIKSLLVMWHLQLLNLKTTIPLTHRSNQAGYPAKLTNNILSLVKYRWVFIALVQEPCNLEISRLRGTVNESARDNDTGASHSCDAARGGEGPSPGQHIPFKKQKEMFYVKRKVDLLNKVHKVQLFKIIIISTHS